MRSQQQEVLLGTRIPVHLKKMLSEYCSSNGIKMSYFVSQSIKERLLEVAEDARDTAIAKERLKNAEFVSQAKLNKYLFKRGIKS